MRVRTRREILIGGAVVFGGIVAACSSGGRRGASPGSKATTSPASSVTLSIPRFPYWPNDVFPEHSAQLDVFARRYAGERRGGALDLERFLYGWMPLHVFDAIFDDTVPADLGSVLVAFHVSGYFGGVWLRGAIDRAQPGTSVLAKIEQAPSREQFEQTVAKAEVALHAARATDDEVVRYCEASLFPVPGANVSLTGDGLAQAFGYNEGYMLQILEHPPQGLTTPAAYSVRCHGTLDCTYATPRLHAMKSLGAVVTKLTDGRGGYAQLGPRLTAQQDAFVPRGRLVWSSGLSVQGFTQRDYETLLDVSTSFLETLQATSLAAAKAAAEHDATTGRRAAVANAAMTVWLSAYSMGIVEGRDPSDVPRFAS